MSIATDFQQFQIERYETLVETVAQRLEDTAQRVRREANHITQYSSRVDRAGDIVHEIHTMLANLPLDNLIQVAAASMKEV